MHIEPSKDERMWAMLCHLSGLALFVPFANIIAPIVIWSIKRDEYPLVNDQGKEAINFQISMYIYLFTAGLLVWLVIGLPLLIVLGILYFVLIIIASVRASEGVAYKYPISLRIIK